MRRHRSCDLPSSIANLMILAALVYASQMILCAGHNEPSGICLLRARLALIETCRKNSAGALADLVDLADCCNSGTCISHPTLHSMYAMVSLLVYI